MLRIFNDLDIKIFFDDVVLLSENFEDHLKLLSKFLKRCQAFGLLLDPKKCQFFIKEAVILGEKFDAFGRKPSDKHIKVISEMKNL